ncbi:MAG TPA: TatD family hydrolase [Clostridiaceae bacterium]
MIFDAHTHYDDVAYQEDREQILGQLIRNNVEGILNCGASLEGARESAILAEKYDFVYAAVGIHPEYADIVDYNVLMELRELSKKDKVKAIGEIGLDYHYKENPTRQIQMDAFRKQMELAREVNLPVIIHDREAHEDTLNILKEYKGVVGEIHCFSGSSEFAIECMKLGYYIGFTGVVTFKNAKKILDVIKKVPLDRILVETDSPYMTPVPFRGEKNRSEYVKYIIEKIAEVKEVSYEELECRTNLNTRELLRL